MPLPIAPSMARFLACWVIQPASGLPPKDPKLISAACSSERGTDDSAECCRLSSSLPPMLGPDRPSLSILSVVAAIGPSESRLPSTPRIDQTLNPGGVTNFVFRMTFARSLAWSRIAIVVCCPSKANHANQQTCHRHAPL